MEDKFKRVYREFIHRDGADALLAYLEKSDFFKAPASTRFHGDHEGGLCEHSVHVFTHLARLVTAYAAELGLNASWKEIGEKVAIVSLLHDLCKIECYEVQMRNRKNDAGVWEQVPFYTFREKLPMGYHGPKSCRIIERYMRLTDDEWVAIATHMGPWDRASGDYSLSNAYERPENRLAVLLHMADELATFFDESEGE